MKNNFESQIKDQIMDFGDENKISDLMDNHKNIVNMKKISIKLNKPQIRTFVLSLDLKILISNIQNYNIA